MTYLPPISRVPDFGRSVSGTLLSLTSCGKATFVALEHTMRGALVCPISGAPREVFYVVDCIDANMFLPPCAAGAANPVCHNKALQTRSSIISPHERLKSTPGGIATGWNPPKSGNQLQVNMLRSAEPKDERRTAGLKIRSTSGVCEDLRAICQRTKEGRQRSERKYTETTPRLQDRSLRRSRDDTVATGGIKSLKSGVSEPGQDV
ncbi:hypothetical protein DFH08DRAFT_824694 [Mycena albidolilacea]|uniref:Uncharacterized protein n=1 Tax=Mycena albidolilacea TaxID=1033008 RepID=A0AAD6Z4D4_9AGAR|nr:hypothetical protein DFH08DRAFT_824694 [Mycena albidolilacea]